MDVFLIEKNLTMAGKILKHFENDNVIDISTFSTSEKFSIDSIPEILPHVVIIDISNDDSVVEYLEKTGGISSDIIGIIITNNKKNFSIVSAHRLGFDIVMTQPLDLQGLRSKIMEYYTKNSKLYLSRSRIEEKIKSIFSNVGISNDLDGYKYLHRAILLCYKDENLLSSVTKNLYPNIAKYFSVSVKSVEKSISKAIEFAWKNQLESYFYKNMGCNEKDKSKKISNKKFISVAVEYIKSYA